MNSLVKSIQKLRNSPLQASINARLQEFRKAGKADSKIWFEELCFCLLAANTSSLMAGRMQQSLGYQGFLGTEEEIVKRLHALRCRFYNRRGHFIAVNNKHLDIKEKLLSVDNKRSWLIENIKGFGWKEASHFLRNVGYFEHAILDKHVVNILLEHGFIDEKPKSWNQASYTAVEAVLQKVADKVKMSQGELDMYLWYMKTGKVMK